MSSENRHRLTSSFPILIPFISSSYLIAVARNSMSMLNMSGENRHPPGGGSVDCYMDSAL
jgi:hypothetical protein